MKSFLTGIGVGTAIGLWLAPDAGRETRKKLMQSGADLAQRFTKLNMAQNRESPQEQIEQRGPSTQREDSNMGQVPSSSQDAVAEVLNSASKTKLRSVTGIGDATARRIIQSRPFDSEAEVVESKIMPEKVLKNLKDRLVDADEEAA